MGIIHIEKYRYPSDIWRKISTTNIFCAIWLLWIEDHIREAGAIFRFLIKLWRNAGDVGKFIRIKFERRYYASVDKRIGSPDWRRAVTTMLRVSAREALVKRRRIERRYVELETYDGPPQSDCTSRIYRPFGRESVILWTQMRRCLRAGHLSRVSRERKGTDPILFMRADDALFATRPSQVNIDSKPDWWTFLACVFRPRSTHLCSHPARLAYPYFSSFLSSSSSPLLFLSIY